MGFFEHTRIDGADAAELSAVTYTTVVLDTGASVTVNGVPLTNGAAPQAFNMRVRTINSPSGNVYLLGTPNEADQTPVVPAPYSIYSFFFDSGDPDYFEGTDTGIAAPGALVGSMTISAWAKHDIATPVGGPDRSIIDRANSNNKTGYALLLDDVGDGKWAFWIGVDDAGTDRKRMLRADVPEPPPRGEWFHIAGTWNDTTKEQKIYINGQFVDSATWAGDILNPATQATVIGCRNPVATDPFDGNIDSVSLWDKALTDDEIEEIFNGGTPGNLNNHSAIVNGVSWWRMGENATWDGSDWTVPDIWSGTDLISGGMGFDHRVLDVPNI